MGNLGQEIASFVVRTRFEDLPGVVVHEAKRALLDSTGCALAGMTTDKGKLSTGLARRLGGPPESSIIGTGDMVSCYGAAFANGELINALDYDTILVPPGHVSPYVIPPALALAESVGAAGKDLILAVALAHEISARLPRGMTGMMEFVPQSSEKLGIRWAPAYGYSQCIFGGAVGAGKILKFDQEKMLHAIGIAGHFCPVPTQRKSIETAPAAMTKYGSAGWTSAGAVAAALLAETGYVGDTSVFDGESGFWRFFASGKWQPDAVMTEVGKEWYFTEIKYKQYPSCDATHSALDCFRKIIDRNNLMPGDIKSIRVFCHPLVGTPLFMKNELATHVDAQFNVPYVFALAAHRVRVEDWQDLHTMRNPRILEFMKKVSFQVHPEFAEIRKAHPKSSVGMVEVAAKGKMFREEKMYYKGTPVADAKATDEELVDKFRRNASGILNKDKINAAVKHLLELERLGNIAELMKQVTLR